MADNNKNRDDFWDLAALLPKKRPAVMRQPSTDTEPVTIEADAPENTSAQASLSLRFREVPSARKTDGTRTEHAPVAPSKRYGSQSVPQKSALRTRPTAENVLEYTPENSLVKKVKIMRWPTTYSFYEQFRSDAIRCRDLPGKPCAHVPFFSYTPQYRQMSQPQLEYYFYWRSECRRGVFREADFAYVLLYVYEIINLYTTDSIPDEKTDDKSRGLDMLADLWLNYREKYKALDKYLSEWLPDYCLIHRLPPPVAKLAPIMPVITATSSFCEFFLTSDIISPKTLLSLSCDYDWRRGKYVSEGTDELKADFAKHIEGALHSVTASGDERFTSVSITPSRASRDAFCGSLCAHSIKRRIDVEYVSFTRSHELRALVTAIVKYAENKLRAHHGIKSRLKVDGLDDKTKSVIDAYFASVYPSDRRYVSKSEEERREERYYEEMYGALSVGIDGDEAKRLEAASWSVTERLTAEEASDEASDDDVSDVGNETLSADPPTEQNVLSALHRSVLRAIADGDTSAASALCRAAGRYIDDVVSEINEYAADEIGDVIIESDGASYTAVEDYADEISAMLSSTQPSN